MTYPDSPWRLSAHAYIGIWVLPRKYLPPPHSPETIAFTLFGRGIVCATWFVYEKPSPLIYNEVMRTMLVRRGKRPLVAITDIWVDSADSRDGGRALWGIPKELAEFDIRPDVSSPSQSSSTLSARIETTSMASLDVHRTRQLPFRLPLAFSCAQDLDGSLLVTPVRGRGRLGLFTGRWSFDPAGPLGHLAGRKPLMSLAARSLRITFGK